MRVSEKVLQSGFVSTRYSQFAVDPAGRGYIIVGARHRVGFGPTEPYFTEFSV
jgi:hypothetical protein